MRSAETMSWRSSRRLRRIEKTAFITRNTDASSKSPCVSGMYELMVRVWSILPSFMRNSRFAMHGLPSIVRHDQ
jgi:hypothetical protein